MPWVFPSTPTDHSGTITAGGTAQIAIPSNARRKGFAVYNPLDATENLFVSFLGTATTTGGTNGTIVLAPGDEIEKTADVIPNTAISVVAATTAHKFAAWEY